MKEHFEPGTLIVIVITFVLFVLALLTKGFTHDLLLEAGIFLVSVKLILMAYKNSVTSKKLLKELNAIKKKLEIENNDWLDIQWESAAFYPKHVDMLSVLTH